MCLNLANQMPPSGTLLSLVDGAVYVAVWGSAQGSVVEQG